MLFVTHQYWERNTFWRQCRLHIWNPPRHCPMHLFPGLMLMYPFSVISVFINIISFSEVHATSYQFLKLKVILETPNVVGVRNKSGLMWKLCPQTWYVDRNFLQLGLKVFGRLGNPEGYSLDITIFPAGGNALQFCEFWWMHRIIYPSLL